MPPTPTPTPMPMMLALGTGSSAKPARARRCGAEDGATHCTLHAVPVLLRCDGRYRYGDMVNGRKEACARDTQAQRRRGMGTWVWACGDGCGECDVRPSYECVSSLTDRRMRRMRYGLPVLDTAPRAVMPTCQLASRHCHWQRPAPSTERYLVLALAAGSMPRAARNAADYKQGLTVCARETGLEGLGRSHARDRGTEADAA